MAPILDSNAMRRIRPGHLPSASLSPRAENQLKKLSDLLQTPSNYGPAPDARPCDFLNPLSTNFLFLSFLSKLYTLSHISLAISLDTAEPFLARAG